MADEDDPKEVDPELDLDEPEPEPEPELEPEEPESEPEPEPEPVAASPEPQPQPEQRPSRRDSRIQSLTERIRERDTELADVRRRLDELTRTVREPKPAGESPEQRAQRRALMTPQDVMQEDLREAEARFSQQVNQLRYQNAETADRTAFQAKSAVNPLYAKYAPKVEGKLAELRAQGTNVSREAILRWMIGDAALSRLESKEGKREVAQAQQRVRRQTVRPPGGGSDTAATRRREESLERRLENLEI